MTRLRCINKRLHGQRGVVLIWFGLLLPVLLGFVGLVLDVARLNLTRAELQNAADATALAGALLVPAPVGVVYNFSTATRLAERVMQRYHANGNSIRDATIETGFWNLADPSAVWHTGYVPGDVPAYRVTIAISETENRGPFKLYFAQIVGIASSNDVQATAVAAQPAPGRSILVQ